MQHEQDKAERTSEVPVGVLHAHIGGMQCVNCAVLVERRLKELPQIQSATVHYPWGRAVLTHSGEVDLATLQSAIGGDGYTLSLAELTTSHARKNTPRDYLEIGAGFVVLAAIALALQHFHLLPRGLSVSDQMSYGLVFLIGLVASVSSCLAVTGGLLVALAAKYNEVNPHLSDRERLTPHVYFNIGRLLSYTLLGGAIGALGSALTLSPAATGALTLLASLIMILLGLSMLGLFPSLAAVLPTMPRALSHRIHDAAAKETKSAAFLLGGATFFLPCGFTQALQLYVLSKGSFATGALTMLAFAVGTMPALLSLSAISSFARGAFQRHFLRFAGAAVILLGLLNIQYGLVLTGSDMNPSSAKGKPDAVIATDAGAQVAESHSISMRVVGLDYQPNQFTVKQGVPVQWWIDGSQADGCGRVLVAPRLRIQKILSANSTTLITFTPEKPGEYAFNCGMGMMTPGSKIIVVPNDKG